MALTVSAAFCARAAATTVAPCVASLVAMARPMPRDAPVTRAIRPGRSIMRSRPAAGDRPVAMGGDALERRLETALVLDAEDGDAAIDLLDQAGQHAARTELDEGVRPFA